MAPILNPGDYVLVDLWRYKNKPALKDEIVVFNHPYKNRMYIKRVAYVANDIFYGNKIPASHYGVIGVNKNNSKDSRVFGSISHEQLMG